MDTEVYRSVAERSGEGERGSFVFKVPANARVELIDLSNNASVWTTSRKLKSLKFKR